MLKKFLISLFVFCSFGILTYSQHTELDTKLQQIKTKYQVVGMTVVVSYNDTIAFSKGYGKKDLTRNLNVDDTTCYRIASISKTISAIALMKLYEQGLFNLDDDVSSYLGWTLRNPNYPSDKITFRKLLSHTSSLRDGSGYDSFLSATYNNNPPPNLSQLLTTGGSYYTSDMFSNTKSPSSNYFTYSNINFGVIGTLVEKLSGKRFDVFCKENIFTPLNISGSFNIQDIQNINNVAVLYRKSGGSWIAQADNYQGVKPAPRDLSGYTIGNNGLIFGPQGGLRISGNDLAKIMLLLSNGGLYDTVRILNDTTVSRMLNPVWIYNGSNGDNYYGIFNTFGLGCHRTVDLLPTETMYGHPGEAYGLISDMYFSKLENFGIIFITNGGVWGYGTYSGWYNIEEEIYNACLTFVDSLQKSTEIEINSVLPDKPFLYCNYPNPFNPKTIIRYNIPSNVKSEMSNVILKVYDMLGQEITTLVNEEKSPGIYEVEFDGSELSSGIYFCKMQTENFSDVKKLVLSK